MRTHQPAPDAPLTPEETVRLYRAALNECTTALATVAGVLEELATLVRSMSENEVLVDVCDKSLVLVNTVRTDFSLGVDTNPLGAGIVTNESSGSGGAPAG